MKKLHLLSFYFLLLTFNLQSKAQYVTIPDANFVTWLSAYYPTCMSGNQMDTTCSAIVNETSIDCSNLGIYDLTGIQYFHHLQDLNCEGNLITSLPTLSDSLTILFCSSNQLTSLPSLLGSLSFLDCGGNQLTSLPVLSGTLQFLSCGFNQITSLPALPNSLQNLYCDQNQLTSLPALSNALHMLHCESNLITSLPVLPNSLYDLYCSGNQLTFLPILPNSLQIIDCFFNQLGSLPALPTSLSQLDCRNNQLTALPALPNSLHILYCYNNQLTSLPSLPNSLQYFNCSNNPNLTCLPTLHVIQDFDFSNTGITCLPNYPSNNVFSNPPLASFPLCMPFSGCPVVWNIAGQVHQDTSSACVNDSLFPASEITNVKVQLFHNGNLQQQMYVIPGGLYSFDTYVPDTAQVMIDTTGLPIYVECPNGGVRNEILSVNDSLHFYEGFGMKCSGIDVGVNHIYGRFRPSFTRLVEIHAGDISQFYNMHCANGTGGTVVTHIAPAFVHYVSPAAGALTPNVISNDSLIYNVADFGAVDFNHAFNFIAHTDTNAIIGNPVCITVHVSTPANDINHSNDSLTFCSVIVSSYDPNEKEVFPDGNLTSSTWLTYTINFQNTGNDTAFGVIVRDTLSQYLDEASFQYLASSHNCVTQLFGNKVVFSFPHINLVDSFTNEPLSHGWVQFKIKTKNNIPSGVSITNRSSIYFDNNVPVLTNTTSNHYCLPNSSAISAAICQGEIYHFGGAQLTVAGNYVQHYINAGGCDSAVNLHLTVDSLTTLIAQNGDSLSATSNGTIQWYDCNTMQIVATGNFFVAQQAGDYAVITTNGNCVDTSACLHVTSVNEFPFSIFDVQIFPNPAIDELNISFSKKGNYTVKITDEVGREVLSATTSIEHSTFNIQHLSSGIYFIEVRGENYFGVKKFVRL